LGIVGQIISHDAVEHHQMGKGGLSSQLVSILVVGVLLTIGLMVCPDSPLPNATLLVVFYTAF